MEGENTIYAEQADTATQFAKLLAAGLTERQIARFVRLRATYPQTSDEIHTQDETLSRDEQNRLAFMRWLRDNGRLVS
jgi:GrpB-like predicted nucleotidyltransferase (UPF0157 family)